MAKIELNIYDNETKELKKTYSVDSIDLMFGTVEDILAVVDLDKLDNNTEVAKMIVKGWSQLKPFLKDIFPGLTDEDIKGVKINEMIPVFMQIFAGISESMGILIKGKN